MAKIKIFGIVAAQTFLTNKAKQADKSISVGISKATLHVHGEVKESVAGRRPEPRSVDTSNFIINIFPEIRPMEGIVFTKVPYAKYLEHGTRRIRPRKHFSNTKAREKNKVIEIIRREIKKI